MRAVLARGGDLVVDFVQALALQAHDPTINVRSGEACNWHEHFDTPACGTPSAVPESEPEPEEDIAQADGAAESKHQSSTTFTNTLSPYRAKLNNQGPIQKLPTPPIPAGQCNWPQTPLRSAISRSTTSLPYKNLRRTQPQDSVSPRPRPRPARTIGGQQDGSQDSGDPTKQAQSTSHTPIRVPSQVILKRKESSSAVPTAKPSQITLKRAESSTAVPTLKPSPVNPSQTESSSGTPTRKPSQVNLTQMESSSGTPTRKPSQVNLARTDSTPAISREREFYREALGFTRKESSSALPTRKQSQPQATPSTPKQSSQPDEPTPGALRRSSTIPRTNPLPSAPILTKISSQTSPEHSPTATPSPRRPSGTPFPSAHASDSPLVPSTPVPKSRTGKDRDCVCTLLGQPPCDNHIVLTRWCDCSGVNHHTPEAIEAGKADSCKSLYDERVDRRMSSKGKGMEEVQWEGVEGALEETDGEECGGRSAVRGVVRKMGCGAE